MKFLITLSLLCVVMCSGCRTINASQSRRVFDERVQERFHLGMSKEDAWTKLTKLRIKPNHYGDRDEDIITFIKPQRAIVFTSLFDYFGPHRRMFMYFGGDNALDRVTLAPRVPKGSQYEIELFEAEAQP